MNLRGDVARNLMERVVRLGGDAGDDEDQVVALAAEPVVQGGDGGIVVDVQKCLLSASPDSKLHLGLLRRARRFSISRIGKGSVG